MTPPNEPPFIVTGTGHMAAVPATKMPGIGHNAIPDFDGTHMWVVTAAWRVNPATFRGPDITYLDTENLLTISGVGCFWCEQEWSFVLSSKPCQGGASPGWRP